jgi:hypothetical protein
MEHGIPARESEMIRLCLTRRGGTPELGLYRGLKLKTQQTPWDVEVLSCTAEAFIRPELYPALLLVDTDSHGVQPWWRPRKASHAIVVRGITKYGTIEVADPSSGVGTWSIDSLRKCWLGDGLRLVRRESQRVRAGH